MKALLYGFFSFCFLFGLVLGVSIHTNIDMLYMLKQQQKVMQMSLAQLTDYRI